MPLREDAPVFDLYFIVDGDYLDVYYATEQDGSGKVFSASFALVDPEMRMQINQIIVTDPKLFPIPFDPSRITFWPRRADGGIGFPPPEGANLAFRVSHAATAHLRVRGEPSADSSIVTTLDLGAEVQVLETGAAAAIDSITAPWVRVLSADGFTGWSFSGYLEPLSAEPAAVKAPLAPAPDEQPELDAEVTEARRGR